VKATYYADDGDPIFFSRMFEVLPQLVARTAE
jgi:hypothetical protein